MYNFGLPECNRVKRNTIMLSKNIKVIFVLQYFLIFLTVKSRYMHSKKKKRFSKKKKKSFPPTYPNFFQAVT